MCKVRATCAIKIMDWNYTNRCTWAVVGLVRTFLKCQIEPSGHDAYPRTKRSMVGAANWMKNLFENVI